MERGLTHYANNASLQSTLFQILDLMVFRCHPRQKVTVAERLTYIFQIAFAPSVLT